MSGYDPNNYGPGKEITGKQMEDFLKHNYHKVILMLMLRQNLTEVFINEVDVRRLEALPPDSQLMIQPITGGFRLFLVGS